MVKQNKDEILAFNNSWIFSFFKILCVILDCRNFSAFWIGHKQILASPTFLTLLETFQFDHFGIF